MNYRSCPENQRRYSHVCNEGFCCSPSNKETGYCEFHGSERYSMRLKRWMLIQTYLKWGAVGLLVPPVVIGITAGLWKFALWMVLQ